MIPGRNGLRVALVGPFPLDPAKVTGGIQAVVKNLAIGLSKFSDLELHAVTVDFDRDVCPAKFDGIRLHYLPSSKAVGQFLLYAHERRWLCQTLEHIQPDVVHVHGTDMYGYASLKWRFPTLLTVHGILHREGQLDYSDAGVSHRLIRKLKGSFNTFFEKRTLAHARHVIVISPYVTSALDGHRPERLYYIDNPVEQTFFELEDRTVSHRVLFVGLIRARKGVLKLVQAIDAVRQEIPDVRVHIVGKVFEPEYDQVIRRYVDENDLHTHIQFLGRVDDDDLYREFEECQVLVLPSAEETSPMVIEQAMAAGKAVVATRVGGVPQLVEDEQSGLLVEYGDVPALTAALLRLFRDPTLARRFGDRGRQIARDRFQLEAICARTREVYYEVFRSVNSNPPGTLPVSHITPVNHHQSVSGTTRSTE